MNWKVKQICQYKWKKYLAKMIYIFMTKDDKWMILIFLSNDWAIEIRQRKTENIYEIGD
jgi:hypothetical protein